MTIHVETPDHGKYSFLSADDWELRDDGGLWIGKGIPNLGTGVAEFANGSWLFVYETLPAQTTEPRTWKSLADVPTDVRVVDNEGDTWAFLDGTWKFGRVKPVVPAGSALYCYDGGAPFIELLEAK